MTPFDIMGWVFAAVMATILIRLVIGHKRPAPVTDEVETKRVDAYREIARGSRANMTFEKINNLPPRTVGKHAALSAQYGGGQRKPLVVLTQSMIERANVERRRRGYPALNRAGIQNAIAHPFDRHDTRQPSTSSQWLTYLILYEVFLTNHQQSHCSGTGGFTIDPNQPYNGQGGEFAGAGASGNWESSPVTAEIAAGIAVGASAGYLASGLNDGPGPSFGGDSTYKNDGGSVSSAPDPSPSASASPSYSAPSSDSSSSSSSSNDGGSTSSSSPDPSPSGDGS